jgi:hypothetical protein
MIRFRDVHHRLSGRTADDGSLTLAMLLVLVGVSLTALMTPMLMRQVASARTAMTWAHALPAAETGLHVALAQIRASNGDIDELPCGPLSGDVVAAGTARYEVSIDYLSADPAGNVDTSYLASASSSDPWIVSHRIACSGTGTTSTPLYALMRALGTDAPTGAITAVPNRAIWAVHKLATTITDIPGGQIRTWPDGTALCFDAGSAQPAVGTPVRTQPCVGGAQQIWAYQPNLTLLLASTRESTQLCMDAGSPHAVGAVVKLQQCGSTTQPRQQWIYNANANFEGTSNGVSQDGYCFNVESPNAPDSRVVLGSTASSTCLNGFNERQSFEPEPVVGAGAAPATANGQTQLVNYKQFAACVEIPGANPTAYNYVMARACKQEPGGDADWNQMWAVPTPTGTAVTATGQISTTCDNTPNSAAKCTNGVAYCLRSPLTTATGTYAAAVPCSSGGVGLTWTRYGSNASTYEQRYQIVDANGRCLTSLENTTATVFGDIHKVAVRTCDGSTLQKWNAAANTDNGSPLQSVGER